MYLTSRGLALRGKRDFDDALHTFDEALRATGEVVHLAERMRVLADAGRWAEAVAAGTELSWRSECDAEGKAELAAIERASLAHAPPPDEPPLDIVRRRALGHGTLVPMLDATANALRNLGGDTGLRAQGPTSAGQALRDRKLSIAVSGSEGPSNRLCLALVLTGEPDPARATYTSTEPAVRTISDRDPGFSLWRLDGDVGVQALGPPPRVVSDWIERLALRDSDGTDAALAFESSEDFLDLWAAASLEEPPAALARDWLAALVHPRMPLCRVCTAPDWVYRWQVVATLGLVRSEPGWPGTEKRKALLALLGGAVDWPLAAAIRVAAEVALHQPEATRELRQVLIDLCDAVSDQPNPAIGWTLLGALDMLPFVPKGSTVSLRARLAERELDGPPEPPPPPPRKRPWWKLWAN